MSDTRDRADELALKITRLLTGHDDPLCAEVAGWIRGYGRGVRDMDCEELESHYSLAEKLVKPPTHDDILIGALVSNIRALPLPGVKEAGDE